jgi:gliding motility-associated-like protein
MSNVTELRIINSSIVSFYEPMGEPAGLSISSILFIETDSELKLNSSGQAILLSIYGQADIYGSVNVDIGEHKLAPYTSTANIVFYSGSSFYEGIGYIGYPFGSTHNNTVHFQDGSNYYHEGGSSPFGGDNINVANFSPESNYYIRTNSGSNIYFSGKTYGNIIKDTSGDIVVPSTAIGTVEFSYNTMNAFNGGIYFDGSVQDIVHINGVVVEAWNGAISLTGGSFYFSATETFLGGSGPISFISIGTAAFEMLETGRSLILDRDVAISNAGTANVSGTIDCRINRIDLSGNLHLSGTSKLITQRTTGVFGSISGGSLSYDPGVSFEYNGTAQQSTGLLGYSQSIGNIYVTNQSGVFMDENISVNYLHLNEGNFDIGGQELEITGDIYFTSGSLIGDQTSSVLNINTVTANTVSIPVPLDLFQLIVTTGNASLVGSGDLNVYTLSMIAGELYINEATIHVFSRLDASNGIIQGGQTAGLVFESSVSEIIFGTLTGFLELGTLINNSSIPFIMPGSMTIYELLEIGPSNFIIGNHALTLSGTCGCSGGVFEAGGMSILNLNGTGDIPLYFSSTSNTLYEMNCSREGIVDLYTDLNVEMYLGINQGKIRLNNTNFRIPVSGGEFGPDNYIITGVSGRVTSGVVGTATTMTIPIGTELYYAPITLSSSGLVFTAAVVDSVYTEGYSGIAVSDTRIINHTWFVGSSDETLLYNLSLSWMPGAQGFDYDAANAQLYLYNSMNPEWTRINGQNTNVSVVGAFSTEQITGYGLLSVSSGTNTAPVTPSVTQEFTIDEHAAIGTVVGHLDVVENDPGQVLNLRLVSGSDLNPFGLQDNMDIIVVEPELIDFNLTPTFNYDLEVCDNGIPPLCTPIALTIRVNDVNDTLEIANYLSPNNDNINDRWIIRGIQFIQAEVKVFNASGNLVFQSFDYQNDWNGTSNGQRLPPGVYIYVVRTANSEYRGTLTLAR